CWTDSHLLMLFPSTLLVGTAVTKATGFGIEWSLLAAGSGMIVGMRIGVCMLVGAILSWVIAPYVLLEAGILEEGFKKFDVLSWVMWPATGMLVASGLTALVLRWRVLVRAFRTLSSAGTGADEFPLRWAIAGAIV